MGRIRTIKPEFHSHEELSALPAETHLLAGALTNYADDYGYFNANPGLVKAGTHPLREDPTSTRDQLAQLEAMGYIEIRSCADGKTVGRIVNFETHQKVSHPAESKLMQRFTEGSREVSASSRKFPKSSRESPEDYGEHPAVLRPEQGTGNREQGIEQGTGNREASIAVAISASPAFLAFPLTGKLTHVVTEAEVQAYQQTYPAVDVRQQLREVCTWLDAHPDKRSQTVNGSKQRIVRWLGREQDKGGTRGFIGGANGKSTRSERAIATSRQVVNEYIAAAGGMDSGTFDCGGTIEAGAGAGCLYEETALSLVAGNP